ncbi:DUF5689 domain-containing protein [Echinicola jeungdonensis]|uniref:DUF5689 domain-containing protein n=1 Tax=Echinicola jeungdonensis TaxID=709343 RepID=A0ABV5J7D6_9BACT|nr:DUF5689 domain-containing protein [Echinicola jeungdonensis]MDN3669106.1 DUF5689 domain-containing protein [Echinicola jeungdonensis]
MKTQILLLFFLILLISGCVDTEEKVDNPTKVSQVNFELESQSLSMKGTPMEVKLELDKPLSGEELLHIRITGNAIYGHHFNTQPEAHQNLIPISILPGTNKVLFTLIPLLPDEEEKIIFFTMEDPSGNLALGNKKNCQVRLVPLVINPPEETPAVISFEIEKIILAENQQTGVKVHLSIEGNVYQSRWITLSMIVPVGKTYGTDFYTNPGPVLGELGLSVNPGEERISFTIFPVNDREVKGDFSIQFELHYLSEGLELGEPRRVEIEILEDDIIQPELIHSIKSVRERFEEFEGDWYFPEDYYIQGIVTSASNVANDKTIYLQDESGGIMLQFVLPKMVAYGDKVMFNLKNGSGKIVNEQKAITDIADIVGIILGRNRFLAPEIVTLEDLVNGSFQGKKVQIENVSFPAANGIVKWEGTHLLKNESQNQTAVVATYAHASFGQQVLPAGKLTLTGIVGDRNYILVQHEGDVIR